MAPSLPVITPRFRVALVLAGCGQKDGSEVTEAVSLLIAFAQCGFDVDIHAPDRPQAEVVDHGRMAAASRETRNILVEANRIARGTAKPLAQLDAARAHAVAFAGGFGVAKNLCDFAFAGKQASLSPDVAAVLRSFREAGKPIAALCIAPVLLALDARSAGIRGARVTLGDGSAADAVEAVRSWGAEHVPCPVDEACVDARNRYISAPAYMYDDAGPAGAYASAQALAWALRGMLAA